MPDTCPIHAHHCDRLTPAKVSSRSQRQQLIHIPWGNFANKYETIEVVNAKIQFLVEQLKGKGMFRWIRGSYSTEIVRNEININFSRIQKINFKK